MTIWEAIVQAVVQGFTEFLPVSSSGHLSLVQHFFGLNGEGAVTFSVVLHLGTLVAVFIAFRKTVGMLVVEFFRMLKDLFTGRFHWKNMNPQRRMIMMMIISILPLFLFYIFKDFFAGLGEDPDIVVEGVGFLYTSALLLLSGHVRKGKKTPQTTTVTDAVTVGVFQGIALVPGVSRSGSTICSALMRGFQKQYAVDYSFVLGIPVILAGALVELKDAAETGAAFQWGPMSVGFVVSAITGFLAISLIKKLVMSDKFKYFGYYTLVLGIVVIAIGVFEHIAGVTLPQFIAG